MGLPLRVTKTGARRDPPLPAVAQEDAPEAVGQGYDPAFPLAADGRPALQHRLLRDEGQLADADPDAAQGLQQRLGARLFPAARGLKQAQVVRLLQFARPVPERLTLDF